MPRMLISVARNALQAVLNANDPLLPDLPGWSNVDRIRDTANGIRGYAAVDGAGKLRIAFYGVDFFGGTWGMVNSNATEVLLDGQVPEPQFRGVERFLNGLLTRMGPSYSGADPLSGITGIELVGHSAGGALEEYSLAYILNRRAVVDTWIPDVSGVSVNGVGIAHLWSDLQSQLGLTNITLADVAANNRAFRVGIDPIAPWRPHFGDLEWLDKPSGFFGWFRKAISKVPVAGFLVGIFTDHFLERGITELGKVSDSTPLPIVATSDFNHPAEEIALARSGFEKYVSSEQVPFDSSTGIVPLPDGKLYVLIPAQESEPARLYSAPVDTVEEGGLVSGTRDGEINLYAAAGALDGISSVTGGAVELVLRTAPESEAQSVVWKPDGSGSVEVEIGGIRGLWPLAAGDQLVQIGTVGAEILKGGDGRDVIVAGAGDDNVSAGDGNDWVYADAGNDSVDGGQGNDFLQGGPGNDLIQGGAGDDLLYAGAGDDVIYGGDGNDVLASGPGEDWLFGGPGDDNYSPSGITHIRDDDRVQDCNPVCRGDHLQFGPGVTPNDVKVSWQGPNLLLRVPGGGGGGGRTVWIENGLAVWDGDTDEHEIEFIEFDDGTVWPWEEVLKRAEPLPEGDPLGDSGPPPDIFVPLLRVLHHGGTAQAGSALEDIVRIFADSMAIISPLVLDLDGDGVETRGVNAGAHFDHDGNGFQERTGWVGADDGLLVWDRNGDGRISGGSELFGNRTLLPDGVTPAANGFAALAAWDANGDGKIDVNDPVWASLRIWRDADSDGESSPQEIAAAPADLSITAINTGYTTSSTVDAQGNEHRQVGSFTRADGGTGAAEDVWFKVDPVHAVAPDPVPVPADVAALPALPGFGTLYSLRQAMARDTSGTLKGLVAAFVAEVGPAQRDLLTEQILFRWAGADTVDPASRGGLMDARQLTVVEAFMGQGYVGYGGVVNPHHQSAPLLKEAYTRLKEWTYAQLDIQTHLADLYRLIPFSWDPQRGLVGDLAPVRAELQARLTADPIAGQRDLSEFARSVRALKAEDMLGFWAFRDTLVAQDAALGWVIDSGGRNVIVGTAINDGLSGTSGRDAIRGGDGDDTLWGQEGEDVLYGDAGRDILYGGPGDDVLVGGADVDQLFGEAGQNRLEGGDGGDWLYGGDDNDLLFGGADSDFLFGNGGDDRLNGGPGNDSLRGGDGADTFDGGGGNDYAQGGGGPDTYLFGRGSGTLTIRENDPAGGLGDMVQMGSGVLPSDVTVRRNGDDFSLTINDSGDQLGFQYFFNEDYTGDQVEQIRFADGTVWDVSFLWLKVLTGTEGQDVLTGYRTDDTLRGLGGSDWMYGRDGNDTLDGGPGNDFMWGEAGDDTLLGGPGDDQLRGGDGADTINGGGGWDYAEGGPGGDTYLFGRGSGTLTIRDTDATPGVIDTIQLGPGVLPTDVTVWRNGDHLNLKINDTGDILGVLYFFLQDAPDNQIEQIRFENGTTWDLATIKQLVLTGTIGVDTLIGYATADTLRGLDGNDTLWGRAGDDRLDGGPGADTMYGEAGNDTYVVDNTADVVVEAAGNGIDAVESSVTYTLPAEVEALTLTGSSAINGTGNALDNALTGNAAANVLDGGAGADAMAGGAGNDTYVVDNAGDVVTEAAGQGTDTVQSSISYTLPGNVENLTLTGTAVITGTGNALNNVLTGNSAANVLNGGTGADTMAGGPGDDTYVVDSTGDVVTEAAGQGTDTVQSSITYTLPTNVENLVLTGTAAINGTGNTLNNSLTGNAAANVLNGGSGADTMAGGAGNDTYVVDDTADTVIEAASQGTDTVQSSVTYSLPANVEILTLTGSAAINGTGNALSNTLTGNSGANVLAGGAGNDTYNVDVGDTVVENPGEGTDTVRTGISYTLPANVENLTLTGTAAVTGTGNALNNVLTGNSAANVLTGGAGNDTYVVGAGDTVVENPGEGTDTVQSSVTYALPANVENLTLTGSAASNGTGNALNNSLTGNTAANVLDGGAGNDTLTGGRGNDTYVFNPGWGQDTINDNDSTAGNTDTVLFGAPVRPLDLVLSRAVNNLAIALHGATDKATVQSWYTGTAYQTEMIQAGDGSRLLSTQVDLLIQAMASYTATTGLTWDQAIDQRPQDVQTVLAGYWQPPS